MPLAKYGDLVMVSRAFCECMGYSEAEFLKIMVNEHTKDGAIVVCSLGATGAIARRGNDCYSSPAFPPEVVVDTVGAGDTFNAALINVCAPSRAAFCLIFMHVSNTIVVLLITSLPTHTLLDKASRIVPCDSRFVDQGFMRARRNGVDIAKDADVVEAVLRQACQVAGTKVGMNGFRLQAAAPPL